LIFWPYVFTKIFIFDIDRGILEAIAPNFASLLDFRLLIYIALLALGLLVFRRSLWMGVAYVAFFPLLVVVWKIPAFFWRRKSFPLLLAAAQAAFSLFSAFPYKLISGFFWLLAVALILFSGKHASGIAAFVLVVLLTVSIGRTIWRVFSGRSFFEVQRATIARIVASTRMQSALALSDQYKRSDLEMYERTDANQIMTFIGMGVALVRALHLWAYELERYRSRFRPSFAFAGLSYVWLFVYSLVTLSFANVGLFRFEAQQYIAGESPSFIAFVLYALGTMTLSQMGGIEASGDLAFGLQLVAAMVGLLVLAYVFLSFVVTLRRERDDQATQELVDELRTLARQQEERFRTEYAMSVDEAERKLREIGFVFASWLARLSEGIPDPQDRRTE
jgi:hypothetical protein